MIILDYELRDIPGFPGYKISNIGEVFSYWNQRSNGSFIGETCRRLKTNYDRDGYEMVGIKKEKKQKIVSVHYLVLLTFEGEKVDKMMCRHLDGNPKNNNRNNLKWGTQSENEQDKKLHGTCNYSHAKKDPKTVCRGEKHGMSKFTKNEILEILDLATHKVFTQDKIAKIYGTTQANISTIKYLKNWKHLKGER